MKKNIAFIMFVLALSALAAPLVRAANFNHHTLQSEQASVMLSDNDLVCVSGGEMTKEKTCSVIAGAALAAAIVPIPHAVAINVALSVVGLLYCT